MKEIEKVWIEEDICCAHYICCHEAPNIFGNSENMWCAFVKSESKIDYENDYEDIISAMSICPVAAIKVQFANGSIVDSDIK